MHRILRKRIIFCIKDVSSYTGQIKENTPFSDVITNAQEFILLLEEINSTILKGQSKKISSNDSDKDHTSFETVRGFILWIIPQVVE